MMQQAQPSLSDAIALGKAGDQAGMQRMMQQIVGLPPSGAPQQMQAAQQREMQNLASQQMALQAPYTNMQMNPQSSDALKQQFLAQQQLGMGNGMDNGGLTPALAALGRPGGPIGGPQSMKELMGIGSQPMQQPGFLGGAQPGQMATQLSPLQQQAAQMEMRQRLAQQAAQQQAAMGMGPQQPGMQQTVGPGLTPQGNLFNPAQPQPGFLGSIQPGQMGQDLYGRPMQLPQQPMQQPPQQFGQAQNPFAAGTLGQNPYARPMQTAMPQGIGQSLQQSSGQTQQQPSNIMGSNFRSAFGGGTQPQQQPQQPGMQQNNPMQKASGSTGRTGLF
jgi:hypothetical protein